MKMLQRILEDIKNGENIDLYITVVIAIVLAVLNILDIVPPTSLQPLNLAILALMTFTILGNRHRLEEIAERMLQLSHPTTFLETFPPEFMTHLEDSKDVWLTGTHHSSLMTMYYPIFERKIKKGGTIHAILIDPNGAACQMAAMRFPGKVTPDQEKTRVLSTLASLAELKKLAPKKVEIRTIDFLVEYSAFLLDPGSPQAIIYMERYTFKTSGGGRKPKFVYHPNDGRWFEHVSTEIQELWKNATPYDVNNDN